MPELWDEDETYWAEQQKADTVHGCVTLFVVLALGALAIWLEVKWLGF
jgi:hypothetical protein